MTVILFCLLYSRIQAASQSKKGLYFPNFRDFFFQFEDFIYSKGTGYIPQKDNKITACSYLFVLDSTAKKKRAKVIFSYEPENEDEIRLEVGDIVEILKQVTGQGC